LRQKGAFVKFLLIGVVLILAIWARSAIRSIARRYKPLFSDVHYLEFIEKAHTLRGAALENINCKLLNPNDPRRSLTSEGIGIIYTIEQAGGLFFTICPSREEGATFLSQPGVGSST
jgi:hypothetical protein